MTGGFFEHDAVDLVLQQREQSTLSSVNATKKRCANLLLAFRNSFRATSNKWIRMLTFKSLLVTSRTARFNIQKFHIVIARNLCDLYGSRNKQQNVALCKIKRSVFITELESVYSAVRTGSLNKAVCASSVKG